MSGPSNGLVEEADDCITSLSVCMLHDRSLHLFCLGIPVAVDYSCTAY